MYRPFSNAQRFSLIFSQLGSYIDFMAAKLENCRTQIVALEKKVSFTQDSVYIKVTH